MPAPAASQRLGLAGALGVVAGAVLVLVALTALTWYPGTAGPDSAGRVRFRDLHRLSGLVDVSPVAGGYFAWLSWTLLIVGIVVGVLAVVPGPASPAGRVAGVLVGLLGAALTYDALHELVRGDPFARSGAGVWLALAGYVLLGVGALVGPARLPRSRP